MGRQTRLHAGSDATQGATPDLKVGLNICLESECGANLWPLYFYLSNIANSCSDSVPRAASNVTSTIVLLPQAALGTLVAPI